MKSALLKFSSLVLVATFAHAAAAAEGTTVRFRSAEPWTASRWYLVGQVQESAVHWLSGAISKLKVDPKKCDLTKKPSEVKLEKSGGEVLTGADGWLAVPADPAEKSDVLKLTYGKECQFRVSLEWSPDSAVKESVLVPYLFLKPAGNVYMGYEFNVSAPAESISTDIQLDLVGGAWMVKLGNPGATADKSLIAAPMVEARGEWTPPGWRGLGFELHMLQSLSSFGGIKNQSILVSEWMGGAFYQRVFSVGQGLVLRGHVDFLQRLIDQGTDVQSIGAFEKDHRGLNLGLSMAQYFSKRWHVLVRGDYTFPSDMPKVGVQQSYLRVKSHLGYLVTDSVTWLVEAGYKSYGYEGHASTTAMTFATGIRLEL